MKVCITCSMLVLDRYQYRLILEAEISVLYRKQKIQYRDNPPQTLPADVEREDVLGQQLGPHGRVKHREHLGYRDGGVGHAQDPVEPRYHKGHARLLHGLAKLLAADSQAGDLRAGKRRQRSGGRAVNEVHVF